MRAALGRAGINLDANATGDGVKRRTCCRHRSATWKPHGAAFVQRPGKFVQNFSFMRIQCSTNTCFGLRLFSNRISLNIHFVLTVCVSSKAKCCGSTLPRTPGPAIRLACGSPLTHTAVSSFWLASHTPPARGPGQLASGTLGVVGGCKQKGTAEQGVAPPLAN